MKKITYLKWSRYLFICLAKFDANTSQKLSGYLRKI